MSAAKRKKSVMRTSTEIFEYLWIGAAASSVSTSTQSEFVEQEDVPEAQNNLDFLLPNEDYISEHENYISDESESSSDDTVIDFNKRLAAWFIESNVSNLHANKLLDLLSDKIEGLPKDIRTLKRTPTDAPTVSLAGGEYAHYGLRDCLTDFLREYKVHTNILELNFNIDGLPISKSSLKSVWPILVNVNGTDSVFVVAIFCGRSHPNDVNKFLAQFVDELNDLLQNGFSYENKTFVIKCRVFILDAPARALMLGVKGHAGYSFCTKCIQRGERKENRMIFHYQNHPLRTNVNFRQRIELKKAISHNNATIIPSKPFANVEDFLNFEKIVLEDIDKFSLLKADLKRLSTSNSRKFVTKAWQKIITDKVAESFSWRGTADKKCIRAFTVTTAIRQTFAENGGKEEDFVFASKSYFQYAKNRIKIKTRKVN